MTASNVAREGPFPMKLLLYGVLVAALLCDFREMHALVGSVGRLITYIPEGLAALILVGTVIVATSRFRSVPIPPRYLVVGVLFVAHVVAGAVYNQVPEGTIFAGIRIYFRYIPLFFLPLIVHLSDDDIWKLMRVVLVILLLQVPLAFGQRLAFPDADTGDMVRGTFASGAILSIDLVAAMTCLFAFHLRGLVTRRRLIVLTVILAAPTLINETKGTIFILPLALAVVAYHSGRGGRRIAGILSVLAMALLFVLAFAAVHDSLYGSAHDGRSGFLSYLLQGGAVDTVYRGEEALEAGRPPGRIDALRLAYEELSEDPFTLLFGLGIGNVSNPSGAELLRGAHALEYQYYRVTITTVTGLFWELGAIGVLFSLIVLAMLFRDARRLSQAEGLAGALGLAWLGLLALTVVSMFYKDMIHQGAVAFPFMLFSGILVERVTRERFRQAPSAEASATAGEAQSRCSAARGLVQNSRRMPSRQARYSS